MKTFTIESNGYLSRNIKAFYHCDYTNMGAEGNPDYINVVKNDFATERTDYRGVHMSLREGCEIMRSVLLEDLPLIKENLDINNLTVCAIPRSKVESRYKSNQLMFKKIISEVVDYLGYNNGVNYIKRVVDTPTTHRREGGTYIGITEDSCRISSSVRGKDILLIDDIYTKTINIDEDCIQALLDAGARSVAFYAIGKTVRKF